MEERNPWGTGDYSKAGGGLRSGSAMREMKRSTRGRSGTGEEGA